VKGQLIAQLDLTEESVQSESARAQAKATFQEAEKNYDRLHDLYAKGMIALQELDAARKAFEVARSQYFAAEEDVRLRKDYSIIRAPFNGVVAKRSTEVGELLLPGKEIVTIVDPDRIYVLATIDEVDVGRLRLGQRVAGSVDAFPDERFTGSIRRISPIVSGGKLETRTADVWISFLKQDPRIKPGMSADIEILISTLQNVLSVPSQAVVERAGRKQVFRVAGSRLTSGDKTVARLVPVEVGESNWVFTEIRSGVAAGDYVVTTPGAQDLRDGARVLIESEPSQVHP
jgi:HlyD family secretion protein